ncbi:MAG: dihydrodipicolinate synthase family protein, partial [Burkholderiales bacterium]|nr:dihydrodipicolinate synthase family protein [Burkholderiales bacterium]
YYKDVPLDGLYRSFSEVIERVGDARLRLYLYHIPPVSQVGIALALIERLLARYPGVVAGIKDSSGDWDYTQAVHDAFGQSGFDVFAGSEVFLLRNMRAGGAGCITATGNVNPAAIDALYRRWREPDAERLQSSVSATRAIFQKYPMMAALKAAIAHYASDPGWVTVRPPLVELTPGQHADLTAELAAAGFAMPRLAGDPPAAP